MKTCENKLRLSPMTERDADEKDREILASERMINSKKEMWTK